MATLQRIRNHSVALLVIVGLAMAAFIVGDLLTGSSAIMQHSRDKVVTVNGTKVTYQDYETARSRMDELQKSLFGQNNTSSEAAQQINNRVFNQFVSRILLSEVSDETGLIVTADEFNELVYGEHPSPFLRQIFTNPSTGEYMSDIVKYWASLVTSDNYENAPAWATKNNWLVIENEIKLDRMRSKYKNLISAAITPNSLEAKDLYNGNNTECTFAYVRKLASSVPDSVVKVSSSDIQKHYEASKYDYKTTANRTINYIAVPLRPSTADFAAVEKELKAQKEEFATTTEIDDLVNSNSTVPYVDAFIAVNNFDGEIKDFIEAGAINDVSEPILEGNSYLMARILDKKTASDSLKVSVIVAENATKADSIMNVLNKNNFAEVAKTSSIDPQSAEKGGELGWMTDMALLQNFGNEVRNVILNAQLNKVVRTEFNNLHFIVKVTEKTRPVELAKVAIYASDVTPSSLTRREEYGKLNNFLLQNKTLQAVKDSASNAGYTVLPATLNSNSYNVGYVTDARNAVRFAFQNEVGETSEIFECGDNLLVVFITEKVEDGYVTPKNKNVKSNIERTLLTEAKNNKIVSDLANVSDKTLAGYAEAMGGASIDTARFVNFNLASISGLGNEPKIIGAALNAEAGKVVGPIAGNRSTVVFSLIEKHDKNLEYNQEEALTQAANTPAYIQATNVMSLLQKYAEIEDNRISFY